MIEKITKPFIPLAIEEMTGEQLAHALGETIVTADSLKYAEEFEQAIEADRINMPHCCEKPWNDAPFGA